jgi:replicative DNA helicase
MEMLDIKGKLPPQNIEAEQSLLGCVFINNQAIDEIIPLIKADDFYDVRNRKIYEAMLEINKNGGAIDIITVSDMLRTKSVLDMAGGVSYISYLADIVPTAANVLEYAKIVQEKAILRSLISTATTIINDSMSEEKEPKYVAEQAIKRIFDATDRQKKESTVPVENIVNSVYEQIKMRGQRKEALIGLRTGYKIIDSALSGLQPQELIIIAARPSLGKTSLALNIAYNIALREEKTVLFFSFEMGKEILVERLLAIGSKINLFNLRRGKFANPQDSINLMEAAENLTKANILIDTDDNTVMDIRSKIFSQQNKFKKMGKNVDLVIIDYLQLIRPSDAKMQREQQIAYISRSLKAIARDLEIPVIALSQLNRDVEKREKPSASGKREKKVPPRLSDLRESGAIEQDADVVIFIDKISDEDKELDISFGEGPTMKRKIRECRLIIAKNRNGPLAEQDINFLPEITSFVEVTSQTTDEDVSRYDENQY